VGAAVAAAVAVSSGAFIFYIWFLCGGGGVFGVVAVAGVISYSKLL